jgi:hypothetical protein
MAATWDVGHLATVTSATHGRNGDNEDGKLEMWPEVNTTALFITAVVGGEKAKVR